MTPFKYQKLGVIPYQRTGSELRVGQAVAPTPQPATYEDPAFFKTPILMQGLSPECGGYSLAFALAYLLNQNEKLSGSFGYAFEKTIDGYPNDAGTTIAAIAKAAHNEGTCLDTLFTDDGNVEANQEGVSTPFKDATQQSIQDAATRAGLIPLFLNDLSWNGLQQAIVKYKAVIVEAQVGDEWYTAPDGTTSWAAKDVLPLRPPKQAIDSHFFVLGGEYNTDQIFLANSWSAEWGQHGFGYFGQDYIPYVKNAVVLIKPTPSMQAVLAHPILTQPEKNSLIQTILDDIEQAVGLVSQEIGGL